MEQAVPGVVLKQQRAAAVGQIEEVLVQQREQLMGLHRVREERRHAVAAGRDGRRRRQR